MLLINGGESLHNNNRVCQYSGTGTDTSPVYLFNKNSIENQMPPSIPLQISPPQVPSSSHLSHSSLSGSPQLSGFAFEQMQTFNQSSPGSNSAACPPQPHVNLAQDELQLKTMRSKVADAINMQASYATIATRTEIARQLHELTMKQLSDCEQLIREQHLQHQGWQAVVANLEDISSAFLQCADAMIANFTVFLTKRSKYKKLLTLLPNDLLLLQEIPILKLEPGESPNEKTDKSTSETSLAGTLDDPHCRQEVIVETQQSLLEWINLKDHHFTLQQMADSCEAVLEHFDGDQFVKLKDEIKHVRTLTENEDNKKIKKIEDRLYQLDETLAQAKKIVVEQTGLTKAFIQNQNSVHSHRDQAILDDLCVSHCSQLKLMMENYEKLCAFKRRYLKAKNELICSLHSRLRVIMHTEKELSVVNSKILIYSENLKKLKRQFEIFAQVHVAPFVYFQTINEMLRRRHFTNNFRCWADQMHALCVSIYDRETQTRHEFAKVAANHFLSSMFVGLDDNFPCFFQPLSPTFDSKLPHIRSTQVERLRAVIQVLKDKLARMSKDGSQSSGSLESDTMADKDFDSLTSLLNESLLLETEQLLQSSDNFPCPVCGRKSTSSRDEYSGDDRSMAIVATSDKCIEAQLSSSAPDRSTDTSSVGAMVVKQTSTESAVEATEGLCESPPKAAIDHEAICCRKEQQLTDDYEQKIQTLQQQFDERLATELGRLRNQLKSEHKLEMDTVRSRFKLACALERSSMESSLMVDATSSKNSTSPVNRDLTLRLHESLRDKEIQIEQLRRSERNLRLVLSRISSKIYQKNVDSAAVCASVREVLESAKHQDKHQVGSLFSD